MLTIFPAGNSPSFLRRSAASLLAVGLSLQTAFANDALLPVEEIAAAFPKCIADLQDKAKRAGVSEARYRDILGTSKFQPQVIGYDRNQPEFVQSFPSYMNKRVSDWRINKGREMLAKHRDLLNELTSQYGIPAHYLVAFWGLETNFGAYKGKMPIIDSLATLACDTRRSEFFTKELIIALQLMDREQLNRETMVGSWAGAMGHTQFMPSAYIQYAVDGDGDAQINLWDSEVDALSSAANFLHNLGWRSGYRWGREVSLPDGFDYALAGKDQVSSLTQWQSHGVTRTDGSKLGTSELQASLLLPVGHKGPAFLVYSNFDVIMRWNNSESYAIAVGYLADRIIGKPTLVAPMPDVPDYRVDQLKDIQLALNQLGYDVGEADGIYGPATRSGIRQFQVSQQMIADGFPHQDVMSAIKQALQVGAESDT